MGQNLGPRNPAALRILIGRGSDEPAAIFGFFGHDSPLACTAVNRLWQVCESVRMLRYAAFGRSSSSGMWVTTGAFKTLCPKV